MEHEMKLHSLVEAVRRELQHAMSAAKDDGVKFTVKRIEMELQFTANESRDIRGGVRTWLFDFGASAREGSAVVQTLKLELTPEWIDGSGTPRDIQLGAAG